jgi:superfamily II DNA or RNA helicase
MKTKQPVKRRHFNKRERRAIYLAADGLSEISGEPLSDDWHADHIIPWSKGGLTNLANAQALSKNENLKKGSSMNKDIHSILTRSWQLRFLKKWEEHQSKDFLLAALPAAGKTRGALGCGYQFLQTIEKRRLVVVVPTLNVRSQWKEAARQLFSIQLLTDQFSGHLNDRAFNGVVVTYQSIAGDPFTFQRLCNRHGIMVIFDEIHHASAVSSWGTKLQTAFEPAQKRLSLTGTPFRSDNEIIPFLSLNLDGTYQCDEIYDYPGALRDGVIRDICFHRFAGSIELRKGHEVHEWHTSDELSEDDAQRRLRLLLWAEDYACAFLSAAHKQLLECRRTVEDAGGLILCIDANHAVKVAEWLKTITNSEPDLILSDEERATSSVEEFRHDPKRLWIVSVRQVSEGVDINRLMVLGYMTNWRTRMFFRQAVGRIMRSRGTDMDTEAYCFLPVDPELDRHAKEIEDFQAEVEKRRDGHEGGGPGERLNIEILGSTPAEFEGITHHGTLYERAMAQQIVDFARRYDVPEIKVAKILAELQQRGSVFQAEDETVPDHEEEKATLSRQCNKLAGKLARRTNREPRDVHNEWISMRNVGHAGMTVEQFKEKKQWLIRQLAQLN